MAWREHLLSFGATAAAGTKTRRVRIAAQLLLLAGLVFVLLRLRSIWRTSHMSLDRISWLSLACAVVLAAVAVVGAALVWLEILRRLGEIPKRRWAGIYLQAQLGKYIPGSLWQYAGRVVTARGQAIPVRTTTASTGVELGGAILAAAVLASLAGSVWLSTAAAVSAAAVISLSLRMTPANRARTPIVRATAIATSLYFPVWVVMGLSFWFTAHALFDVPYSDVVYYTGAFSIAWLVGLVAFFAPGGIGVREAVLTGLLHARIGTADAVLVAATSRIVLTVVDIGAAAVGVFLLRKPRSPESGDVLQRSTDGATSQAKR